MLGRRGKYSTLEGDSQLQNVSKEDDTGHKGRNRKTSLVILAGICVVVLAVVILVPVIVVHSVHNNNNQGSNQGLQCPEAEGERVDCNPEKDGNLNEDTCHSRGCCWVAGGSSAAPYCFFPDNYGYNLTNVSNTDVGVTAHVQKSDSKLPYLKEVWELKVEVYYETDERLRVKVCVTFYIFTCINVMCRSLTQIIRGMRYLPLITLCQQRKQKIHYIHLSSRDPKLATIFPSLYLVHPLILQCE